MILDSLRRPLRMIGVGRERISFEPPVAAPLLAELDTSPLLFLLTVPLALASSLSDISPSPLKSELWSSSSPSLASTLVVSGGNVRVTHPSSSSSLSTTALGALFRAGISTVNSDLEGGALALSSCSVSPSSSDEESATTVYRCNRFFAKIQDH